MEHFVAQWRWGDSLDVVRGRVAERFGQMMTTRGFDAVHRVRELLAAIHLDPATADASFARAERRAAHVVRVHAPLILKIAAALDRQRELTAAQIRALMMQHQEATR